MVNLPNAASTSVDNAVVIQVVAYDSNNNVATGTNLNQVLSVVGSAAGNPVFLDSTSLSNVVVISNGLGTFTTSVKVTQQLSIKRCACCSSAVDGQARWDIFEHVQLVFAFILFLRTLIFPPLMIIYILGAATHYFITQPPTTTAGVMLNIQILLQDQYNNTATAQSGTVALKSTGSLAFLQNGGVVTVTNGVGTTRIVDFYAETVTLSLASPSLAISITSVAQLTIVAGLSYFSAL